MTDDQEPRITPLMMPTRTQHAEVNGSQVIASTAMPEPVIHALASLVDALSAAFRLRDDAERESERAALRRPCRWHLGQYADFCSGCRAEEIEAYRRRDEDPEPTSTDEGRAAARALYEHVRRNKTEESAT